MNTAEEYTELLWTSGAILLKDRAFTLKSGRTSSIYVNHRNLICVPKYLRFLADAVLATAQRAFSSDSYAFGSVDSSVSPFLVSACSVTSGIPFYNFRAVNREKGLTDQLFSFELGNEEADRLQAILIDDVVTTMRTLNHAAQVLEEHDVHILGSVCLLDRRVASEVASSRFTVASVVTLARILAQARERMDIGDRELELLDIEATVLRH